MQPVSYDASRGFNSTNGVHGFDTMRSGEGPLVVVRDNRLVLPVYFAELDAFGHENECHYYPQRALDAMGTRLPNSYSAEELGLSVDFLCKVIEAYVRVMAFGESPQGGLNDFEEKILDAAMAFAEQEQVTIALAWETPLAWGETGEAWEDPWAWKADEAQEALDESRK